MLLPKELIDSIEADLGHIEAAVSSNTGAAWKLTAAAELERIAAAIREAVAAGGIDPFAG